MHNMLCKYLYCEKNYLKTGIHSVTQAVVNESVQYSQISRGGDLTSYKYTYIHFMLTILKFCLSIFHVFTQIFYDIAFLTNELFLSV